MVIAATLKPYSKLKLCVECYAEIRIENERTGRKKRVRARTVKEPVVMNKYGTADKVQKKDGKAVISAEKLSPKEVKAAVSDKKTASPKKGRGKKVVVADEDYRQED
jgi:hypothetical protein